MNQSSPGGSGRLPSHSRAGDDELPPFQLTSRDREIVRAVYEYRALNTAQIERLFFCPPASDEPLSSPAKKANTRCQRRLQLLFHAGFLARLDQAVRPTAGRKPFVYMLARGGAELLVEDLGEPLHWSAAHKDVGTTFIEHLLFTNDCRIAASLAADLDNLEVVTWIDDADLRRLQNRDYVELTYPETGKRQSVAIVPDGYFKIAEPAREGRRRAHHYFLEADRGTVTGQASRWERRDWRRKVAAYNQYVKSGKFAERYGGRGLRILTVTTSDVRVRNLKKAMESAGGKRRFWITTIDRLGPRTFFREPIWHVASEKSRRSLL